MFGSKTAGHPEREVHLGIETTTGPLGPGICQRGRHGTGRAVRLAQRSTGRATPIIDHHTYCFLGDGCMMEGISHEVASFAGVQHLGKRPLGVRQQRHLDRRQVWWAGSATTTRRNASPPMVWHVICLRGRRPKQRCHREPRSARRALKRAARR